MTVTVQTPYRIDVKTWRVEWSSDLSAPTFYVWQDGVLIATTDAGFLDFLVESDEALVVEVLDDANEQPQTAFPGRFTFQWEAVSGTKAYRVEEYLSGVWTARHTLQHVPGQTLYSWRSRHLEDDTTHQFRVIPIGDDGNEGTALAVSRLMVRNPDPPTQSFSFNSGTGGVTCNA